MKISVVIGGCRDYYDYSVFCSYVNLYLSQIKHKGEITIISGHCSGVDMMAERYAKENDYALEIYPAEWGKYGKAAGPIRNKQMVEKANYVIAFWDYQSKGTKSLIDFAKEMNKPLRIKII